MKYSSTSSIATATIALATAIISQSPTPVNAQGCGLGDDIACYNGGTCTDGPKNYLELGIPTFDFLAEQKRGMHCTCEGEGVPYGDFTKGFTGVHCDVPFEACDNGKVCFHEGSCVAEQFQSGEYHCQCPMDPKHQVWAGTSCTVPAEDFCDEDDFYDITGGKWFCTRGGTCINGEKDLSKKCDCPAGTFGLHCEFTEEQSCSLKCSNGGHCKVGMKDFSKMEEYGLNIAEYLGGQELYGEHCVCPQGFSGVKCETENVQRCGDGICFNGAECVQTVSLDGKQVYDEFCRCQADENGGFAGKYCEHASTTSCPAPYGHDPAEYFCTNGGECPDSPHLPCKCKEGFTGPKCEIQPGANENNEFDCDLDCGIHGVCFYGQSPVIDEELEALQGNSDLSFLTDNRHCRCDEGYVGIQCELKKKDTRCNDDEHFCIHGHQCLPDADQYTCDCRAAMVLLSNHDEGYCETRAAEYCLEPGLENPQFCSNHGKCWGVIEAGDDDVRCLCDKEWTGKYCEMEALDSSGIASQALTGFLFTLFCIALFFGSILLIGRWRKGERDIEYEQAYGTDQVHNPYGEVDSDLSDGSDSEEYEFKEIAII